MKLLPNHRRKIRWKYPDEDLHIGKGKKKIKLSLCLIN
jgi:hypothetical protein